MQSHIGLPAPCLASLITTSAARNPNSDADLLSALEAQVCTQSVWTIDLAHVLHRHGFDCEFTSDTLGVSDGLADLSYYRSVMSVDEPRVRSLFQRARELHMRVAERRVSTDDIKRGLCRGAPSSVAAGEGTAAASAVPRRRRVSAVSGTPSSGVDISSTPSSAVGVSADSGSGTGSPNGGGGRTSRLVRGAYIVLTDARCVRCLECYRLGRLLRLSFAGHFIVLIDYDPHTDVFTYANPACHEGAASTSERSLVLCLARRSRRANVHSFLRLARRSRRAALLRHPQQGYAT